MNSIYLDNNSTTRIDPRVIEVMSQSLADGYVNPASQHREGQRARRELEKLRSAIVEMLGGQSRTMSTDQLIITSGGTESNNLAVIGLAKQAALKIDPSGKPKGRILVSAIEHPSVIESANALKRMGFHTDLIAVDQHGVVHLNDLADKLGDTSVDPVTVVSLMLANNETGVIQPVAEAAKLCRQHSALLHTDAVQVVGKIPVRFAKLGCDAMSFTAHKLHGPRGIGGLLLRSDLVIQPTLFGGFQQMALRPGTEDVALLAGMHKAIEIATMDARRTSRMQELRDLLESQLSQQFSLTISGQRADRTPHTSNISFNGINRQAFLMAADFAGLAISTGSACASGSSEPSPVLLAMNANNDVVEGSIRISLGADTTREEIFEAVRRIGTIVENLSNYC